MNSKHLAQGDRMPPAVSRGKIRVYSNRFCPYSQRVILVLDAKKIPHEIVNINLMNKPDWLYDKSPGGRIPTIQMDSGDTLYDSLIIADFLDEKYHAHQLNPKNPLQKAKNQLLLRQFSKVTNALLKTIHSGRIGADEAEILSESLKTFENELSNRPGVFFGGNKPGMLDFMIWPWCERSDILTIFGRGYLFKKEKYTNLMEWRKAMIEDETVKKSFCKSETHIKYLQAERAGVPEYDLVE